jgi:hypothetical protein
MFFISDARADLPSEGFNLRSIEPDFLRNKDFSLEQELLPSVLISIGLIILTTNYFYNKYYKKTKPTPKKKSIVKKKPE